MADNLQPQIEYNLHGEVGPEGIPSATPEQIAPLYWELSEHRDQPELVFNG